MAIEALRDSSFDAMILVEIGKFSHQRFADPQVRVFLGVALQVVIGIERVEAEIINPRSLSVGCRHQW